MPRYFIRFKAIYKNGVISEHTRMVDMGEPIEYDSDVQMAQKWGANEVGAESAMLVDWKLLKGDIRPEKSS